MAKSRPNDWGANEDTKDGYFDESKPDNNKHESDPTDESIPVTSIAPLSNPFTQGGYWRRKNFLREEGQPFLNFLNRKILSDTDKAVTLDNGHILRKTDLAVKVEQTRDPIDFANRMISLVNIDDLAGKSRRHSPA